MRAYVCVYRSPVPKTSHLRKTHKVAEQNEALGHFLEKYQQPACFYDWGDDPSFFAARHFLGDVRKAGWGVCRRDVRLNLGIGDLIVFFCAQQQRNQLELWNYNYIGFGTVGRIVRDRGTIWHKPELRPYRKFFNLLVDSSGIQMETFFPHHQDWMRRGEASYIIFSVQDGLTHFNLLNPLLVAAYHNGDPVPEVWRSKKSKKVDHLRGLLFNNFGVTDRCLRTSARGNAHPHINLSTRIRIPPDAFELRITELRTELWNLSQQIAVNRR